MRNLIDVYANVAGAWAANVSQKGLTRTLNALDGMRLGTYGPSQLGTDLYEYLRDLMDFRGPAAVGIFPCAALDISSWSANAHSNFVQVPAMSAAQLRLTPLVNAKTQTSLPPAAMQLNPNGGENSVRVQFVAAAAGPKLPKPEDMTGLFQGAIYVTPSFELIATVQVVTHFT